MMGMKLAGLKVKLFSDGADVADMLRVYKEGIVSGFTTNPTLMKKAGIRDYQAFAQEALSHITDCPISFEVFSDDFASMEREARIIHSWGSNVNIKIPVMNTQGVSTLPLIRNLSAEGMQLNVTAILTLEQVAEVVDALAVDVPAIVSVFAGRIADTGRDPIPVMQQARQIIGKKPLAELLWASTREVLNIFQAEACDCHIITVTPDILKKLSMRGKDLQELSLDTVRMFYADAQAAGFKL
jgi:transaldolase